MNIEKLANKLLCLKPTGPLSQDFGNLGYSSTLFINNLGTFGVVVLTYFVSLIVYQFLRIKYLKKTWLVRRFGPQLKAILMWNFLAGTVVESSS